MWYIVCYLTKSVQVRCTPRSNRVNVTLDYHLAVENLGQVCVAQHTKLDTLPVLVNIEFLCLDILSLSHSKYQVVYMNINRVVIYLLLNETNFTNGQIVTYILKARTIIIYNVCILGMHWSFFRGPFVPGDSNTGLHKRSIYEHNGVVCSQKRALCIATVVFAILFAISLIIAFAGPQNGIVKFL